MRPGTEPVYLLAGFGAAARLAGQRLGDDMAHGQAMAKTFKKGLLERGIDFDISTGDAETIPGSLSIYLPNRSAEDIVSSISPYASISTGSACTSGQIMPSHVLMAMGIPPYNAASILRIFFGRYNSYHEIDRFLPHFVTAASQ